MVKNIQNLVNAQVEVNRAVFAANLPLHEHPHASFQTEKERRLYIEKCVEKAIEDLSWYLEKK